MKKIFIKLIYILFVFFIFSCGKDSQRNSNKQLNKMIDNIKNNPEFSALIDSSKNNNQIIKEIIIGDWVSFPFFGSNQEHRMHLSFYQDNTYKIKYDYFSYIYSDSGTWILNGVNLTLNKLKEKKVIFKNLTEEEINKIDNNQSIDAIEYEITPDKKGKWVLEEVELNPRETMTIIISNLRIDDLYDTGRIAMNFNPLNENRNANLLLIESRIYSATYWKQ